MSRSGKTDRCSQPYTLPLSPDPPPPSHLGQVTASHLGEGYINWHLWSLATSPSESVPESTWPTTRTRFRRCRSRSQSTGSNHSNSCCLPSTSISRCNSTSRSTSCLSTSSWWHRLLPRPRTTPHRLSRNQRRLGHRCCHLRRPRPSRLSRTPPLRAHQWQGLRSKVRLMQRSLRSLP